MKTNKETLVNNFAIKIATVNGTGSASANSMLLQAIYRLGVPVTGKNIFPSNIQGLPTWYEIRVSSKGNIARTSIFDLFICMNIQTLSQDIKEVKSGGIVIYDSSWVLAEENKREDVTFVGVPLAKLCNKEFDNYRTRVLLKNIAYVGVFAALANIDVSFIEDMIRSAFAKKPKIVDANIKALHIGYQYTLDNYDCPSELTISQESLTTNKILIDGNTACALGSLYAGATVGAWYPITPSTGVMDAFQKYCNLYRVDKKTGKSKYCIIQAEDELAAVGMAMGAAWMGARSFTPTSGPGISLMSEFIGFAYYSETPLVIFNIQRNGPATGMPTRTQQADILLCAYASHGDTRHILLFPSDPKECFEYSVLSYDLAEQFQTPVFLLSDIDIGMNDWLVDEFEWDDDFKPNRGKVLSSDELDKMKKYHRYLDVDNDGICPRTYPGVNPKGAFFTRGSGHNKFGAYTENSAEYKEVLDRLVKKFDLAKKFVPKAEIIYKAKNKIGFITIGANRGAVLEAKEKLNTIHGQEVNFLCVKAFPFHQEIAEFINKHEEVYIIEQNRDAQLLKLLQLESSKEPLKAKMKSILDYAGMPLGCESVVFDYLNYKEA